jgi:hypothetical protein
MRLILMLPSCIFRAVPAGYFPSTFPAKILETFLVTSLNVLWRTHCFAYYVTCDGGSRLLHWLIILLTTAYTVPSPVPRGSSPHSPIILVFHQYPFFPFKCSDWISMHIRVSSLKSLVSRMDIVRGNHSPYAFTAGCLEAQRQFYFLTFYLHVLAGCPSALCSFLQSPLLSFNFKILEALNIIVYFIHYIQIILMWMGGKRSLDRMVVNTILNFVTTVLIILYYQVQGLTYVTFWNYSLIHADGLCVLPCLVIGTGSYR